ncbi:hypothetical protein G6F43_003096 [Rhizopus delemar]|nr:hypothetical protein G6F43_003096 [Rhizopus delemar]
MTEDNHPSNPFYFNYQSNNTHHSLLFENTYHPQQEYDIMLSQQPSLSLDHSSSSCQSSPSLLYETSSTRSIKKQPKKKINSELKRQIHIQSEQKRRAQIKDGFDELRNELPTCLNKKMSKVALLHRTVQHIQHLKNTQTTILAELERLLAENERLRKFKDNVLQNQALEKMYSL